jgi:Flp pilus assembly protein TadG
LIFFALVFATIEFGRLVWTHHELENGTREAMRYAVVHGATSGDPADDAAVTDVLLDKTSGINNTVAVTCANCGGDRGTTVVVNATYDFQSIVTDLIGLDAAISLSSESEGVIHK